MRCYKCNSVLSETNYCNGCGADVAIYKKIIRLSNTYYNTGLQKAKIRDLSGAAQMLRRSVRTDKHNTQARNLLGLVYFEMGECVEAMSQWVISKNFQPEKNLADKYLKNIQSNPTQLDLINQTAKKFNAALNYANEGSDDLAIVQLKRVLNMTSNYIKAAQLLALLYMKNNEYEKARKVLVKTSKIDVNNTLTISYLDEIEKKIVKDTGKPLSKIKNVEERPALSGDDVIIPQTGYKEGNAAVMNIINVLLGIVLGAALIYFLVTPAREKSVRSQYNDQINQYSEKIASNNLNVSALEKQIEELEKEKKELETKISDQQNNIDEITTYDQLLSAAAKFAASDLTGCALEISKINVGDIASEGFKSAYNALKATTYTAALDTYVNEGTIAVNEGRYDDAIALLLNGYQLDKNDVRIVYQLGKAYWGKNGNKLDDNSKKYFEEVIKIAPDSNYSGYAKSYIS